MNALRDWLNTQLGPDAARGVQIALALLVVILLLIGLTWVFRRISGRGFSSTKGGRLGVVDAAPVDAGRRLVLLRRDDVEHLVMIGGPNDLLVESRIVRAQPARPAAAGPLVVTTTAPVAVDEAAPPPSSPESRGQALSFAAGVATIAAFVRARLARPGKEPARDAAPVEASRDPIAVAEPAPAIADLFDAPLGRSRAMSDEPPPRPITPDPIVRGPAAEPAFGTRIAPPPPVITATPAVPPVAVAPRPNSPAPSVAVEWAPTPAPIVAPPARIESPVATTLATPEPSPKARRAATPEPLPPTLAIAVDRAEIAGEIERGLGDIGRSAAARPSGHQVSESALLSELDSVIAEYVRDAAPHAEPTAQPEPLPVPSHAEPAPARVEPHFAPPPEPPVVEAAVATPVPPPAAEPVKAPVDELEEEMARLLSELSGPNRR